MTTTQTTTAKFAPKTLLALFASASKPGHSHEVRVGADGNVYCTCPAWRFQKGVSPIGRQCKHTRAAMAQFAAAQPRPAKSAPRTVTATVTGSVNPSHWERF